MPVLSKKGSSNVCGWICFVWPSWVWESQHASTGKSVSGSLGHTSRSCFHPMAFFPSLKQNFITYRSSSHPDCIFEIHQLWQSGFSRVYSNCYCSCSFKPEIIKIGQSSHEMYSNNVLNFQESTTILTACTKKSGNLLKAPRMCANKWLMLNCDWNLKPSDCVLKRAQAGLRTLSIKCVYKSYIYS